MPFEIPHGFAELLTDFTVAVVRERPPDLIEYAIQYFTKLRNEKKEAFHGVPDRIMSTIDDDDGGVKFGFGGGGVGVGMKWNVGGAAHPAADDDEDTSSSLMSEPTFIPTALHRKSVAAERFNPESDEDDDDIIPTYPKSDTQRKMLREKLNNVLVFKSVDDDQKESLLTAMFEKKVDVGDVIIRQGDDGDNFYVIESGVYDIFLRGENDEDNKVGEYNNTGSFGELALMYNTPRAATVIAASEGTIWALDRTTFKNIVVRQAFKKRQLYETLLEEVPLLKELTTYERMNVADALKARSFKDGEYIIRQGEPGVEMYFVEEGTVVITRSDGRSEVEMTRLGKGAYFGELALVTNQPRAASARSLGETKLVYLDVLSFERLLGPCMDVMKRNIDAYTTQLDNILDSNT